MKLQLGGNVMAYSNRICTALRNRKSLQTSARFSQVTEPSTNGASSNRASNNEVLKDKLGTRLLRLGLLMPAMMLMLLSLVAAPSVAQEAEWIWAPDHAKDQVPTTNCFFRRTFNMKNPESGEITIAADDYYELFLNNRKLGTGRGTGQLERYNVSEFLTRGKNVIAIKVENREGDTAAVVARVQVKERGAGWASYSTNSEWKANLRPAPLWTLPIFNDRRWEQAQSFGRLGTTAPWDRAPDVEVKGQTEHKRFQISREFEVKRLLDGEETGSLIAMAFNEFGQIVASQEGGPLLLIDLPDEEKAANGAQPKVSVYCDLVESCQGVLPLNGDVYVTGEGPDGLALYRLADLDRDGVLEDAKVIMPFKGGPGEHGPHGLTLGPDGLIYAVIGNHAAAGVDFAESSPVQHVYEGDTVVPRYEDPGGHASGVKAPGGVIMRTTLDGERVELVASGLRNAYDIAFDEEGNLFVHDSDMESDLGTSWYRPTRVYHVIPGSEFGWRSGWSKWPDYYPDGLPGFVDTGRGSPTGAVVYNHFMFPTRYHNTLFLGDWSEGRILAIKTKPQGSTVTGDIEIFLQGAPLNVTDLDVGPDGALYFCTGGRETNGGVYRISWLGEVPASIKSIGEDLAGVIRQPQLQSAWARQRIAGLKIKMGDSWSSQLRGVALSPNNPPAYRTRALELMQLFGPVPSPALLGELTQVNNEEVRAKAAYLLGLRNSPATKRLLIKLLDDDEPKVRRLACESLLRIEEAPDFEELKRMLISEDQFETWSARQLLQKIPNEDWIDEILETENQRLFVQGALALMITDPSKQNAYSVLARISEYMRGFVSDRNFVDMLRIVQLGLVRGEVDPEDIPAFANDMAKEFPSGNSVMNREIVRILAYLKVDSIADRYALYLKSDQVDEVEKVHLAMYLPFIQGEWSSKQRLDVLEYMEAARIREGGGSYEHYVMKATRDFAQSLTKEDVDEVLRRGHEWPNAALRSLYLLPNEIDSATISRLIRIDERIRDYDDDSYNQLKTGIIAILAGSGDDKSMDYLKEIWFRDPERRSMVALGLAENPEGENWTLLVASLQDLDEKSGGRVLSQLRSVNQRPEEVEYYRQLILLGERLGSNGAANAIKLLEFWTGEQVSLEGDSWETSIEAWQGWFASTYPDFPPAVMPVASDESKWDFDELLEYLESDEAREVDAEHGKELFVSATCAKCHRFGSDGASVGPDLTNVARRFTRRELLQSIMFPSHVISDQYSTKTVITLDGKQHTGMIAQDAEGNVVVLKKDATRVEIAPDEIEEMVPSIVSSMPNGLLEELTQEEIADLFAYLGAARKPKVATLRAEGLQRR